MSQSDRITGLVGNAGMKVPVQAATTAAITLSGEQTIDGVAITTGERVLVKNQASSVDNGIYVADTSDWERAKDADGPYDFVQGSMVLVYAGTTNGNKIFKCTSADTVDVGTDALTFAALSAELTGSSKVIWCGTAGGSANAIALSPPSTVTAADLNAGLTLLFKAASDNSGATTIDPSATGAVAAQNDGNAMVGGEIESGLWYRATLDASGVYQVEQIGRSRLPQNVELSGVISPAQLTATTNDWAPTGLATASTIRFSTDASRNITGLTGGVVGRIIILHNVGAQPAVLKTADTGSTAANRFLFDSDITLQGDQAVVLQYDATTARWRAARVTNGEYRSVQVYTTPGANTWTKPAGLKRVKVTVVGGGGAGGGSGATGGSQTSVGSGGGAGGAAIRTIAASALGVTETATVGAAGTASSGNSGGNGGTSSFGAFCSATGGVGGVKSGPSATVSANGSAGGSGSGGDINFGGGGGSPGFGINASVDQSGSGGNSIFGGGANGIQANNPGQAASAYGGGGSGSAIDASFSAVAGGAGGGGVVIVEEFF